MIESLPFLRPLWLLLMPIGLAAIAIAWSRRAQVHGVWQRWVDPVLQPFVLTSASASESRQWPWWLAVCIVVIATLAMAGPRGPEVSVPVSRSGDAMVIALDLSRSMDATDLSPSRLARARLKLQDILQQRDGGDTGLVLFSANAFVAVPLTTDVGTIDNQIPALSTSLMPSRGSYPESGLIKARQLLDQAGIDNGRVLLITDGGDVSTAMPAARALRDAGHQLSVLAVGTEDGGPIPLKQGGFLTNGSGRIALPRLQPGPLKRLARAGGGVYVTLTSDDADVRALNVATQARRANADTTTMQSLQRYADLGPWLIPPLLLLLAAGFRRGGVLLAVLLAVVVSAPVQAWQWQDLWQTPDQQGQAALDAGDAKAAADLFADDEHAAAAHYLAEDYATSAERFTTLAQQDGGQSPELLYNAGTALARAGQIDSAIGALEAALEIDPQHADARFNLELLQQLKDQQQQQGEGAGEGSPQNSDGQQQAPQDGQPGESDADQSDPQSQDSSADSAQEQEQDGPREDSADEESRQAWRDAMQEAMQQAQQQQQTDQDTEAMSVEDQEAQMALEQWLRRVPDDPGELLRRKFRRQYQRRQVDQDGNRLWPDDQREPW
ncbi:MAG: VWA domain-containing protein [Pseudomonadota bacterium]